MPYFLLLTPRQKDSNKVFVNMELVRIMRRDSDGGTFLRFGTDKDDYMVVREPVETITTMLPVNPQQNYNVIALPKTRRTPGASTG